MSLREIAKRIWQDPVDVWYFFQGILRYRVYRKFPSLIWPHIREQYEWRKKKAMPCYMAGECCCGCRTPEVFFADKACPGGQVKYSRCLDKPQCYPPMMNRRDWQAFKTPFLST